MGTVGLRQLLRIPMFREEISLDITGDRFLLVDFDDCQISFEQFSELPAVFEVILQRVVLHTTDSGVNGPLVRQSLSFDSAKANVCIKQNARIEFRSPQAIDVRIAWYEHNTRMTEFRRNNNDEIDCLEYRLSTPAGQGRLMEYDLGGRYGSPPGDCNLNVRTNGGVLLFFNPDDCQAWR